MVVVVFQDDLKRKRRRKRRKKSVVRGFRGVSEEYQKKPVLLGFVR